MINHSQKSNSLYTGFSARVSGLAARTVLGLANVRARKCHHPVTHKEERNTETSTWYVRMIERIYSTGTCQVLLFGLCFGLPDTRHTAAV